jgi:hypothetical protein
MKRVPFIWSILVTTTLLMSCSLPGGAPQGEPSTSPTTATSEAATAGGQVEATLPEPTIAALPANLIAFYPLTADFADLTGNNGPATAAIGSPSPDGIFCNGTCDVTTPYLSGLNFNAFTIRVEFLEPKYPVFQDSVFVGGEYRWTRFTLLPDGKVTLGYSNDYVACSVQYQLNVWHEGVITYDGTTLKLYLDGTEGCSIATPLMTGGVNLVTLKDAGRDSSFLGIVKNLQVYDTVEVPQVRIPQPGNVTLTDTTLAPVDILLASCPSEAELAAIDAGLNITFEADPSTGELVCTASAGSRDLTSFKRIVYTTLLVMKKLEFNQPLPWTDKQLYTWFVDTIDGVRFRSDIENSSCCDPAGVINIQTALAIKNTNKWIDPQINTGALDLLVLFVHEARHNEFGGHTCGANDNTRAEMGAWGVQYYLYTYLANNLKDPSFLTVPNSNLAAYYAQIATKDANAILTSSFCLEK